MLYLVYCESANYCGYGQHFVVEAPDRYTAESLVEPMAEDYFYEQDGPQLEEEEIDQEGMVYSSIMQVEEFGPEHADWKYYMQPDQAAFYTKVNLD